MHFLTHQPALALLITESCLTRSVLLSSCLYNWWERPVERALTCSFFLFVSLCFNWGEFIREELCSSWERLRLLSSIITVQDELSIISHVSSKDGDAAVSPNYMWQNKASGASLWQVHVGTQRHKHTEMCVHPFKWMNECTQSLVCVERCWNSYGECSECPSSLGVSGMNGTSLSPPCPMWLCYRRSQTDKKCPTTVLEKGQGTSRMLNEAETLVFIQRFIKSGLGFPFVPLCWVWSLHEIFGYTVCYSF